MAASDPLRQVIVDDTDPSIGYNAADWFPIDIRTLNNGNFGPVFNATSHATTSSNTKFSFSFNGTSIMVQGNTDVATDPATNSTDPTWQCLVDGEPIPIKTFTDGAESNWPLCSADTLAPEQHILTVQVQSHTKPFFLDGLVYTPVPGAVFPSAVLIYTDGDPALTYSAGQWKEAGEQVTQIRGASVTLEFHGTSATLIGQTSNEFPPNSSSGIYFVDGAGPTSFTIPGLTSNSSSEQFHTLFFTTPLLADDFHNVTVVYDGDSEHTPLAVKRWYVTNTTENNTLVQGTASGSATVNSIPRSAPQSGITSAGRRANTGLIVAGVIGGIFLFGLLLIVLSVLKRRRGMHTRHREAASAPAIPMRRHVDSGGSSISPMAFPAVTRPTSSISWGTETWTFNARSDANSAAAPPYARDTLVSSTSPSPKKDSWYEQPQLYGLPR